MFWLCRLLCPLYVANSIGLVTVSMIVGDTCTGTHMPMCDVVYVEYTESQSTVTVGSRIQPSLLAARARSLFSLPVGSLPIADHSLQCVCEETSLWGPA